MPNILSINCNFRFDVSLENDYKKFINLRQVFRQKLIVTNCKSLLLSQLRDYKSENLQHVADIECEFNKSKFGSYCSSPNTMFITDDFIT